MNECRDMITGEETMHLQKTRTEHSEAGQNENKTDRLYSPISNLSSSFNSHAHDTKNYSYTSSK